MLKRYVDAYLWVGTLQEAADSYYLAADVDALIAQKDLRIRELEQQLMTEAEKRAAFEKDCG